MAGCRKEEPSVIGLDVQPTGDRILNIRNCSSLLSAYTMREDSIASDERTFNLLGTYNDPVFGLTSASIVTQVMLASTNVDFGSVGSVDSAVLYLQCKGSYPLGTDYNLINRQKIIVYEYIGNKGTADSWFSNATINNTINPAILDEEYVQPNDSGVIAIHIDKAIASRILNTGEDTLLNPIIFLNKFKGFYICPSLFSVGNSILYVDLLSPVSKFRLYYKDSLNNAKSYDLVMNSSCARVSLFQHDYSQTIFKSALNREDINSDKVYIQSMSGPRVLLKTPSFDSWKDSGNIVINKAQLVLTVDGASDIKGFAPPGKLFLVSIDENGKYVFLKDYINNQTFFGGGPNKDTTTYTFNIPIQLQDIINGKIENRGFYLFPLDNKVSGNRVVLLNNASNRIAINFTYTKL